jgi:hypothetical protein
VQDRPRVDLVKLLCLWPLVSWGGSLVVQERVYGIKFDFGSAISTVVPDRPPVTYKPKSSSDDDEGTTIAFNTRPPRRHTFKSTLHFAAILSFTGCGPTSSVPFI